ncbi:MAG: hypothetical protein R2752_23295 [Vicinamibacterales bacterium]
MTDLQTVFLALIAAGVVVMAVLQVAVVVAAAKFARQASQGVTDLRRDLRPLIDKVNRISDDAARATSLAAAQVERLDQVMSTAAARIDETMTVVQGAIIEPVRQGTAAVAAIRAAVSVFKGVRNRAQHGHHAREDDEALFVG